jgi:RNA polymerase sigma-70 factor (ECF subfamily)
VAVTTEEPETPNAAPGGPLSFDDLYAAHFAGLTVPLFAYLGDRQQAQDIVQEAFCRALTRWRTVSRDDDPVGWIRRAAWHLAVSRWRRTRTALGLPRRRRVAKQPRTDVPASLISALGMLPPAHRRTMVLRYLGDLTVAEIADQENVAEETVLSRLHQACSVLATQLDFPETNTQEVRRA